MTTGPAETETSESERERELVDTSQQPSAKISNEYVMNDSEVISGNNGQLSREDEESIELARMLMAEEAMASYHHHLESMRQATSNTLGMSPEEYSVWQIAMQEEEREEAEEAEAAEELSYDGLLQLSERIGDVRTERWAMIAANEIEKLPLSTFTATSISHANLDDSECKCLVCQCEYEENEALRRLPCGHFFHQNCVDTWLKEKDCCPYCRQSIVD
jgi:hypothetical protein